MTGRWRKSSFCNGADACVEIAYWTACGAGEACVEVGLCPHSGEVLVRDSKDPDGPTLQVAAEDWQAFVEAIAFRARGDVGPLRLSREGDNVWAMTYEASPGALLFGDSEVAAFVAGVKDGEFDVAMLSAGDGSDVDSAARVCEAAVAREGAASVSL